MAPKRHSNGAGSSRPSKTPKSTRCFPENIISLPRPELEALLIKKISEIDKLQDENKELKEKLFILQGHTDANQTTIEALDDGRYEIRFLGTAKEPVYTDSYVKGEPLYIDSDVKEEGEPLKVEICYNGKRITWEPFASAKFEIVVLQGDFPVNNQKCWSADEFVSNLVKKRKGVRSILAGACRSKFSNGEATLSGLKFKDNSNRAEWRLGIRILGSFNVRVLEAVSEPFRVRDRHGKEFEKLQDLKLTDGVKHLKKIGKMRVSKLREEQIKTIKDFLKCYHEDKTKLLNILGIKSEQDKSWETMIQHAKECDGEPSTRADASQSDQTSDVQNGQAVDGCMNSSDSDDQMLDTESDGDQDARTDHNIAQHNNPTQGVSAGMPEREPTNANVISSYSDDPLIDRADAHLNEDDNTAQHYNSIQDQPAGFQDLQPLNVYTSTSNSDDQLSEIETDADQNPGLDHQTSVCYSLIQGQTAGVQERQTVDVSQIRTYIVTLEGNFNSQDYSPNMTVDSANSPVDFETLFQQWLDAGSPVSRLQAADAKKALLKGCTATMMLLKYVRKKRSLKHMRR